MDSDYSAQDVARCDLCKTAIAQNFCDFCHVNLCKPCIGDHISDEYDKHKIVLIENQRSTLIYPKCKIHQQEDCKYECKNCKTFVCFECTVSKEHKGHEYLRLEKMFTTLKEKIDNDADELENLILPIYEEIAHDLEIQIASLDGEYYKLTTEISKQREEIHKEVDNAFNKMEKEIAVIKVDHKSILLKQLDEIREILISIHQNQVDLSEWRESNKVCTVLQYISKNAEFGHMPPRIIVTMPKFIPKQIKRVELRSLFGELKSFFTKNDERVLLPSASVRELLDEPKVLNTIRTKNENLRSVTCQDKDQIWTCTLTSDIKCFNDLGVLQKTISTKSGNRPMDVAVNSNGTLLYSDFIKKTVNQVINDGTEEIITLKEWTPYNLYVTFYGKILVTMFNDDETQSKVACYSGSTVMQTIQFDDKGQPLFSGNNKSKYISENKNLDICVADYGAGAIVVVNQAGKLRFRYTGRPSPTKNKPFRPCGITTDSQGHILTTDTNNHCIHILDVSGRFLRLIDNCDLDDLSGLCVSNSDILFVCEYYKGNVKRIKYLK